MGWFGCQGFALKGECSQDGNARGKAPRAGTTREGLHEWSVRRTNGSHRLDSQRLSDWIIKDYRKSQGPLYRARTHIYASICPRMLLTVRWPARLIGFNKERAASRIGGNGRGRKGKMWRDGHARMEHVHMQTLWRAGREN